ncbi:hypothetical protein J4437_02745 [Candidatus Woesearchaeota archaeon]|nr:hypothetical protein [Candidatus Woesearchaeota archaeon]
MTKKSKQNHLKLIILIIFIVVLVGGLFWMFNRGETLAGQAGKIKLNHNLKSNLILKSVYDCKAVDNGITIRQTKASPRESKSNSCIDPSKVTKYSCEGTRLGRMNYKSSELACTGDRWCENGVCRSCALGKTRCGSSCLDLQTDFWACGSCDSFCRVAGPNPGERAEACVEGVCVNERKVLVCNINWFDNDDFAASPMSESDIDNIFERVNAHLLDDFPGLIIKLTYEVYNPQVGGVSGLSMPDYIIDVPGEVVPYCGVNNMKDFDYVVYPFYHPTLRLFYDVTDDGSSMFGDYSSQLDDTWGISIFDFDDWEDEAVQLEESVITLINDLH